MEIGKPILEKLVVFSTMILNSIKLPEVLRQSLDFSNSEDVIKKRLLLVAMAKVINWDSCDLDFVDVSNIASWNRAFPMVKESLVQVFEAIHLISPTLSASKIDQ
jgi:hypothetical protein